MTIEPTILDNIREILRRDCGIDPDTIVLESFEPAPDRIRVMWHQELVAFALANGWHVDSGKNHGGDVRLSLRQPATPSMQICIHYRVNVHPGKPNTLDLYLEIDIDKQYAFGNVNGFIGHSEEVIQNSITHGKTNQDDIRAALNKRWGIDV